MNMITCAALDERGVFRGMVGVDEARALAEPAVYLPQITECDLPPGHYRWVPDPANPMGGAFAPLPKAQRAVAGRPTFEQAFAFDLLQRHADGAAVSEISLQWLDDVLRSVDFSAYTALPVVQAYAAARGLDLKKGA